MDMFDSIQRQQWPLFYLYSIYRNSTLIRDPNHVHWTGTADTHFFSVELPGVRKENIRVEMEDSTYLVIRTEEENQDDDDDEAQRRLRFLRKFRLPEMVDVDRITADFVDGVLTVNVPRFDIPVGRGVRSVGIDPTDLGPVGIDNVVARAA